MERTLLSMLRTMRYNFPFLKSARRSTSGRYLFMHAFFRRTLYEELIAPRRLRPHQQVARAIEGIYTSRPEDHAAELVELLLGHYHDEKKETLKHLDFAINEFREMKMQPSLGRALQHKDILKAWTQVFLSNRNKTFNLSGSFSLPTNIHGDVPSVLAATYQMGLASIRTSG